MPDRNDSNSNIDRDDATRATGRFNVILALVAAALAVALWLGTNALLRRSHAARLPELPNLSTVPAPVAAQIREAQANAERHPGSGVYLGVLARTYHANTYSRRAEQCYRLAAARDPDNWRWPYASILLAEELGDTERALEMLREFVTRHADHDLAWIHLGEAEFNVGNDEAASAAFDRAEELSRTPSTARHPREPYFPLSAYARFGKARIMQRQGRDADIVDLLEPVTQSAPRFGPAHRLLGRAYERLGRDAEAKNQLDLALDCGPYTPPVDHFIDELTLMSRSSTFLLKEAGVAFNKADVEWSERVLRRAIEYYPDDEDVIGELTLLLCRLRRYTEAMPYLDRFLALPPTHFATPSKIAAELVNPQYMDKAIECYRIAVELQPGHPPNHLNLGMALATAGRFEEAEPYFRETLRLEPHNYLAQRNLARLMLDTHRYEEAVEQFRAVLEIKPEDADGRLRQGQALEALGRTDEAIVSYRLGLETDPDNVFLIDALASRLAERDEFDEAFELARHLVEIAGQFPQAHFTLARVAYAAGDLDLVRAECRRALQLDPSFEPARQMSQSLDD